MHLTRRSLLTAASTSALATVAPGLTIARAAGATNNILVALFLRGGSDELQLAAPAGDQNYIAARPTIRIQSSGANAGLGIGSLGGTDFYFHPALTELKALYDARTLAVVHATGVVTEDRSHFTVQDFMERGIADGEPALVTGWLARHLNSIGAGAGSLDAISTGPAINTALVGHASAAAIADTNSFSVRGAEANSQAIRAIVAAGSNAYEQSAIRTLNDFATVRAALRAANSSTSSTAEYTNGDLSAPLRTLAALIKANIGVAAATGDMGGWDNHQALVPAFQGRATELSRALNAFWNDLSAFQDRLTIVTMTEFGRRFQENANQGTDHG